MITDLDIKKLLNEFKKVFVTKEDLRVQKEDILDEMDLKLKNLREEIAQDFADAVGPFMHASDNHDHFSIGNFMTA